MGETAGAHDSEVEMAAVLPGAGDPTGPMVTIQFTPEPGDYIQTMRGFLWRDARVWITMGLVGIMLAAGIANLVAAGELTLMGFSLALFPLVLAGYLWLGLPLALGRRVRREPLLRSATTYHLRDTHLEMRDGTGESRVEWSVFHHVLELKAHYLLMLALNRRSFIIVPRRAFVSAEQEALFREIVARHLPGLRG